MGKNRNQFSFSDLQEVFNPFDSRVVIDRKDLDIEGEIEVLNREIDEALEFYFKSDLLECPKFSWEK